MRRQVYRSESENEQTQEWSDLEEICWKYKKGVDRHGKVKVLRKEI